MTVHTSGEQLDSVLAQIRAEQPLEQDPSLQAIIHHECGVLEELRGDSEAATRDYLAARDADPDFREPLQALIRIYSRAGDHENLGRMFEMLVDVARSPEESADASWQLGVHRLTAGDDIGQAKASLEQAIEQDPDHAATWLELELLATRDGDPDTRMRALEARAKITTDPTWQGLLLIDLAELCAAGDAVERASTLLDTAAGLEGRARFRSRVALEAIAAAAGNMELQAHALEGQAELITQSLGDPDVAGQVGVPRRLCTAAHAADVWLRAGELRRRSGDPWGAVAALAAAAERLDDSALVARLRIAAADAAGDTPAALTIAREQLAAGVGGAPGSALWMRVGQAAELEGDQDGALEAYAKALELDADNVAALTMRIDLLAAGDDAATLAASLQVHAADAGSQAAQARAWISVAYVWSVRAGDADRGQQALAKALELGVNPEHGYRLARSFASLAGEDGWYERATLALFDVVEDAGEKASLLFELGRMRLRQNDEAGAVEAFGRLATLDGEDGGAWLGRALAAYGVGLGSDRVLNGETRDHQLVAHLARAESDEQLRRGMTMVAATLAGRNGAHVESMEALVAEHEREPADVVVAVLLADAHQQQDDVKAAAAALATCAAAVGEAQLAASLQLEAGFLLWAGDKDAAIQAFEQAIEYAANTAQLVLAWALRGAKPDDPEARQRSIELAEDANGGGVAVALERLGIGLGARDAGGDVQAALERLEDLNPGGDIALAAAMARVLAPGGDEGQLRSALVLIDELGGAAATVAAAERFRVARFVERDGDAALRAARAWADADPSLHSCLEWLAAAHAADDRDAEIEARTAFSEQLADDAGVAAAASTAVTRLLHEPGPTPLMRSSSVIARLVNMELALPGSEPSKRAVALRGLGDALGDDSAAQALRMAAWSDLAGGAYGAAQNAFKALVEAEPDNVTAWEGFRASSEALGDFTSMGVALAQLGNLSKDDVRSAEFWEQAGLTLLEHTTAHADAEIAFQRALDRDNTRAVAFDKLFRRLRKRKDNDRLLELIELRLTVTEDPRETTKMYWERARVYRDKGDSDRALQFLKDVTLLEPDHVGAYGLSGEIAIKKGDFAQAAPLLAKLATLDGAPNKQRLLSGIAAVDLFEKKLGQPDKALGVLSRLYSDGLSTLKVRERLARTAAKVGDWDEAVKIIERLMSERGSSQGRAEAARLAMAIYRDKLGQPARAAKAVERLLEELPGDVEAIELLLSANVSDALEKKAIPVAKELILQSLATNPFDKARVELIADIAALDGDANLRRAALGVAVVLGNEDKEAVVAIAEIDASATKEPQIVLDSSSLDAISDDEDTGPMAQMFAIAAATIGEAMGPSRKSEDVGRRDRVDSAHPMRSEVSRWMGALGFSEFIVYVGGRDAQAVKGIAADEPELLVGEGISVPFDLARRSAVAREVFALRRGTTPVMYHDDNTIASIVVAMCKDAGVKVADPPYAVFGEVERRIKKAMSRKIRKQVAAVCKQVVQSGQDAHVWAASARRSIDRMALIASGDVGSVLDEIVGPVGSPERTAMAKDARAQQLLSFALSAEYLELRKKLGMGVA